MTWLGTIGQISGITLIVLTGAAALACLGAVIVRWHKRRRARRENLAEIMRIARDMQRRDEPR